MKPLFILAIIQTRNGLTGGKYDVFIKFACGQMDSICVGDSVS